MKTKFQKLRRKKGKCFDPLVVEEFDGGNEWADSLHVHPQGGCGCECDLTWDQVDEVLGASESLRGRNLLRRSHNKCAKNSAPSMVQKLKRMKKIKIPMTMQM